MARKRKKKSATSRAYYAYTRYLKEAQYRRDWQAGKPDTGANLPPLVPPRG